MENEVSSWIAQLQRIASNPRIGQTYSSRPPSNRSSQVSPTFSSASGHQQYQQLTLGFSSNHSSSNFLHPSQALNVPLQTTSVPSLAITSGGTVTNAAQDNSVDETDNAHLTLTQDQVPQYSQYMNTGPEQHQFTVGMTQEQQHMTQEQQQQFTNLVSSSTTVDQYANQVVALQPGMVDNSAGVTQQLLGHHHVMPSWSIPNETVTQMSTNITQASNHPPQFNTVGITGSDDSHYIGGGLPADSTGVEQNMSSATMQTLQDGFNAQYIGTSNQQPVAATLPNSSQASLYSNFVSQPPSNEANFAQTSSMPSVTQQLFSAAQPVMSVTQSVTSISQPFVSTAATVPPSQLQLQNQQPGEKKEPSSKEDTGMNRHKTE